MCIAHHELRQKALESRRLSSRPRIASRAPILLPGLGRQLQLPLPLRQSCLQAPAIVVDGAQTAQCRAGSNSVVANPVELDQFSNLVQVVVILDGDLLLRGAVKTFIPAVGLGMEGHRGDIGHASTMDDSPPLARQELRSAIMYDLRLPG